MAGHSLEMGDGLGREAGYYRVDFFKLADCQRVIAQIDLCGHGCPVAKLRAHINALPYAFTAVPYIWPRTTMLAPA